MGACEAISAAKALPDVKAVAIVGGSLLFISGKSPIHLMC
jgi:hypothetical protein